MFESFLTSNKTMYFKSGNEQTFQEAMIKLSQAVGQSPIELEDLEEIILHALIDYAKALSFQQAPSQQCRKTIEAFYSWVQSIHNENLIPQQGARFPNNIIYDMISKLRNQDNLTEQEVVLRFFLEGANARKISNGNTPSKRFISTALVLETISAVKTFGACSQAAELFKKKYDSVNQFEQAQRLLENVCTTLKSDLMLSYLHTKNIFDFQRTENPSAGANIYHTDSAISQGFEALDEFDGKIGQSIEKMVSAILTETKKVFTAYQESLKSATLEAIALAKWDASEWIAKLHVALEIAVKFDSKYKTGLINFTNDLFINDIIKRNKTGDYPANQRDDALAQVEIIEIFLQAKLAEATASDQQAEVAKGIDTDTEINQSDIVSNNAQKMAL